MDRRTVSIGDIKIGGSEFIIIAGPCTIENKERLLETGKELKNLSLRFIRGGAFKMRSSPNSFQGLGKEALGYMKEICDLLGLTSVSEIVSIEDLDIMYENVDVFLVGTRNMQNYRLLQAIGVTDKPVILKRGMGNTLKEWVLASEYISKGGNQSIIFCERGIRTFENYTRNTLDISAVPAMKELTPYPIIVDPSHSSGRKELVKSLAWAAAAAGADGLLIESEIEPCEAICDSEQIIDMRELKEILYYLPSILKIWSKKVV
jgi:3-deoxy-7-phosphoheptulonate synthase